MSGTRREKLAVQLAGEHRALRGTMDEIESLLDRQDGGAQAPERGAALLGMVVALHEHLLRHFQLEESEEFFDDPALRDTTTWQKVERFTAEHREFERRFEEIVTEASEADLSSRTIPSSTGQLLRDLFRDLREHESAENSLFQGLVIQDSGGGG